MSELPNDSYWAVAGEVLAGPYPGSETEDEAAAKPTALVELGVTAPFST